jgi:hypothetical protein
LHPALQAISRKKEKWDIADGFLSEELSQRETGLLFLMG